MALDLENPAYYSALSRGFPPKSETAWPVHLMYVMRATNSFRDLEVWQQAMTLVEEIYQLSGGFPQDERFGLTSQIRRAAVSVPSNIGEGARRKRRKANLNHLDIALGSQGEVEVQLEIAKRLKFCDAAAYKRVQERVERVGRMLNGLITSLQPTEDDWA